MSTCRHVTYPMAVSSRVRFKYQFKISELRRKIQQKRYLSGKGVYRQERMELTIPSRYKNIIEPFLDKDLKVEARREGNNLIIDAKPAENTHANSGLTFIPRN